VRVLFRNRFLRLAFVAALVVTVLFASYIVFTLYFLPGIIKSYLERKAVEMVGGEAHVNAVETQLFTLAFTARDFSVANETFKLTWDSLHFDAQLRSIPARSVSLNELRVHELQIVLKIDEKSSVSQLEFAAQAFLARANEPLYIERFTIQNGSFEIIDRRTEKENRFMIKPITFSLEKFSTQYSPEQGNNYNLQFTGLNGGFFRWNGNLQWMPFLSEGEMEIRGLDVTQLRDFYQKHLPFVLQNGTLDLRTSYRLTEEPEFGFELKNAKLALNKPAIFADSSKFTMKASSVQLRTLQLSSLKRTIFADNITLDSLNANYSLRSAIKQPSPELFEFVRYNEKAPDSTEANIFSTFLRKIANLPRWQIQIDSIQTKQAHVGFIDSITAPAVAYNLNVERLLLTDIANSTGNSVNIHFASLFDNSAKLNFQGAAHLFPLQVSGTFDIKDYPLTNLQTYFEQVSWLKLRRGRLAGVVDMRWHPSTEPLLDTLFFAGNAKIDSLRLLGKDNNDLLGVPQTDVKDLNVMFAPRHRFQIGKVNTQSPIAYLARQANSGANFSQIMKQKTKPKNAQSTGMPLNINLININGGVVYFTDKSPTTPFSYRMAAVNGNLRNISNQKNNANISIQGKMGGYAPFFMKGSFNLSGRYPYVNFMAETANQDLVIFSPYSGRHAGYKISKGQVALQVDYKIQNNKVNGKNHLVMQHLTFGEKVESPEATNLPVRLGVALLSDKNGVIDLDLAIEGDLDDPEFSVGSLIWKIIKNLLGKAVSAPFKSLMSLVGSSSDPESITFAPGSESLGKAQIDALKNLSNALMQRPQLQVDVRGNADPDIDGNALKEAQLLKALARNMPAGSKLTAASVKKSPLRDTLFAYYKRVEKKDWHSVLQNAGPGDAGKQEELQVQASDKIWNELLANQKLPQNALTSLATARAQNVKLELINVNATLGERIFVVDDSHLPSPVANLKIREY